MAGKVNIEYLRLHSAEHTAQEWAEKFGVLTSSIHGAADRLKSRGHDIRFKPRPLKKAIAIEYYKDRKDKEQLKVAKAEVAAVDEKNIKLYFPLYCEFFLENMNLKCDGYKQDSVNYEEIKALAKFGYEKCLARDYGAMKQILDRIKQLEIR
jgi:hypothetical protein